MASKPLLGSQDHAFPVRLVSFGAAVMLGLMIGAMSVLPAVHTASNVRTAPTPTLVRPATPLHRPSIALRASSTTPPLDQRTARVEDVAPPQPSDARAALGALVLGCLGSLVALTLHASRLAQPHPLTILAVGGTEDVQEVPAVLGKDDDESCLRRRFEAALRKGQDAICKAVEECDGKGKFRTDAWRRAAEASGGGGISRVMADGAVWEKAGVNLSVVWGQMPQPALSAATDRSAEYLQRLGLQPGDKVPFFVVALSCVMHPRNPHCPTMHFNYRYFELDEDNWWFGGGTDITPAYLDMEDMRHFHGSYKQVCDKFDPEFYPRFKARADEYFQIKHRGETRGLGGIFFDDLNDRPKDDILQFCEACLGNVLPAYLPIIEKHKLDDFTESQKRWQLIRRGRYVEFNLVYDRGTIFGLKAGGRIESILMSLPETCRWEYNHAPEPGTEEDKIYQLFKNPGSFV